MCIMIVVVMVRRRKKGGGHGRERGKYPHGACIPFFFFFLLLTHTLSHMYTLFPIHSSPYTKDDLVF